MTVIEDGDAGDTASIGRELEDSVSVSDDNNGPTPQESRVSHWSDHAASEGTHARS